MTACFCKYNLETQARQSGMKSTFLFWQAVHKTQVALVFNLWSISKTFTFMTCLEYQIIFISLCEKGSWSCLGPTGNTFGGRNFSFCEQDSSSSLHKLTSIISENKLGLVSHCHEFLLAVTQLFFQRIKLLMFQNSYAEAKPSKIFFIRFNLI